MTFIYFTIKILLSFKLIKYILSIQGLQYILSAVTLLKMFDFTDY